MGIEKYARLFLEFIKLIAAYKVKKIDYAKFSQGLNEISETKAR